MDLGVRLTVVPSQAEADVICGLLRVNSIPCNHREAGSIEMLGGLWHEVLVPADRLEQARELLASEDATPPP
jgi:Putative prokaryotic signal transducing protein